MKIEVLASGSGGNATLVTDDDVTLLFDAGLPYSKLQELSGYRMSNVDACCITHAHADHSKAVKELAKNGIDIYSSQGTFEALGVEGHRFHSIMPKTRFRVKGDAWVSTYDVKHDAPEPLGFCLRMGMSYNVLYFSDTAYVKYKFNGHQITHIIAECNHSVEKLRESVRNGIIDPALAKRILHNHMSIERLEELIKSQNSDRLQQVDLIHLSDNNSEAQQFKERIQKITGVPAYIH
jgi:phosphoribosyl 1,2-cyclic phosphodiesterase